MRKLRLRKPGAILFVSPVTPSHAYRFDPLDRCSNCTLWEREIGGKGRCMKSHKITWFNSICRFFRKRRVQDQA